MDDILDIDELLKDDSFNEALNYDDDISHILQEWRTNDRKISQTVSTSSDINSTKYIDTRTFTRPKKRTSDLISSFSDNLLTIQEKASPISTSEINMKVGGPVFNTSYMQKSWLDDVSPPQSFTSSIDSMNDCMANSLITSSDFSNINLLLNNSQYGDDEHKANMNYQGYFLNDVINDRKYLETISKYTDEDDVMLAKDSSISKTDINSIEELNSGTNTPINNIDSCSSDTYSDGSTIIEAKNLNLTSKLDSLGKHTFIAENNISSNHIQDSSYSVIPSNATFDKLTLHTTFTKPGNSTYDKIENNTFSVVENQSFDNGSMDKKSETPLSKITNITFERIEDCTFNKITDGTFDKIENQTFNGKINRTYDQLENSKPQIFESPPVNNISKYQMNKQVLIAQSTPTSTVYSQEINDLDLSPISFRRQSILNDKIKLEENVARLNRNNLDNYIDENHMSDKRLSLQTFEYFEKSISLLDEKKDENEFDEMLNNLTENIKSSESDKLRQSLDNIKKRHSLLNLEKQQEDLLRKMEVGNSGDDGSSTNFVDNKLMDSLNKSGLMTASHGGSIERLLNRRSRICDEQTILPVVEQKDDNTNNSEIKEETNAAGASKLDKKNRDRFKTIRISKRWEEGMIDIADVAAPENNQHLEQLEQPLRVNPIESDEVLFKKPETQIKPSKMRALSKPKYYGSAILKKEDLSLPLSQISNSNDHLESGATTNSVPPLKSPMGIKSKSYHNLSSSNKIVTNLKLSSKLGSSVSKLSLNSRSGNNEQRKLSIPSKTQNVPSRITNSNQTFTTDNKLANDRAKPSAGLPIMRTNLKRPGLIRPSSGYYNYGNPKRNDSDTESGRYSPNSLSSSSASSRGSLYRSDNNMQNGISKPNSESNSVEDISLINNQRSNTNLVSRDQQQSQPVKTVRPSGLRPPTAKSGLPRPTTYVKK